MRYAYLRTAHGTGIACSWQADCRFSAWLLRVVYHCL
jgi:hypothetical protein